MENDTQLEQKTMKQKETNLIFQWIAFIFMSSTSAYLLYANDSKQFEVSGTAWLIITILAIICFPNKRFQVWLVVQWNRLTSFVGALFNLGVWLVIVGIVIWIALAIINSLGNGLGSIGKYEGQTAKEWFYDYDEAETRYQELRDCVETFATSNRYMSANDLYYGCL